MKKVKYNTIDGGTVELDLPETQEEEAEIQRKMETGEIDDSHGFSEAHLKRGDKPSSE